jgi:hypothetical protein
MEQENKPQRRVGQRTRDDVGNVLKTGKASTFYLKYETKDDLEYINEVTGESKGKIIDRLVKEEADKLDD